MAAIIEVVPLKHLSKSRATLMNKFRKKEFGIANQKDFFKDYGQGAVFFFSKKGTKIVSFGTLRKIKINYLGKNYDIFGICNIISIEKRKGYGKALIMGLIEYMYRSGKTGIGFCSKTKSAFYRKSGLSVSVNLSDRFALRNPKTEKTKYDKPTSDGIYFEGKDGFIRKLFSTKSTVYYYLPDITNPHW